MSRAPIGSDFFHAGARVLPFATPFAFSALHCSVVNTAIGVFEVTLEQGINAAESLVFVRPDTTLGDLAVSVTHTSDTLKTVTIFFGPGGTAIDAQFDFKITRIRTGS